MSEKMPKHVHKKWKVLKTDESAAESSKVDYSDKGIESEEIVIVKPKPKKPKKGPPMNIQQKRIKPEDLKDKAEVIEKSVLSSEKGTVSADGDPEVHIDLKPSDDNASKQVSAADQ